jgi:hypothetical protein
MEKKFAHAFWHANALFSDTAVKNTISADEPTYPLKKSGTDQIVKYG